MNVVKIADEGVKMCGDRPRRYICTRAKWHRGDHAAHVSSGIVVDTWRRKRGAKGVGGRPASHAATTGEDA